MGHALDGVHWRTDLMTHGGQKTGFGLIGRFSRLFGKFESLLRLFSFGDIDNQSDEVDRLSRFIPNGGDRQIPPDRCAVFGQVTFFNTILIAGACHDFAVQAELCLTVFRMRDGGKIQLGQFIGLVAKKPHDAFVKL